MNLIRNLLGLSRVPHSIMDVALPAFSALAWLGTFPSMKITVIGLVTAISAYLAIYALNDLVDACVDREKRERIPMHNQEGYLDALLIAHPLAQGTLRKKTALTWVAGLLLIAVIGSFLLNPMTLWILALGAIAEMAYCLLFKKSAWRVLLSGFVKTCGPIAAVLAVDHAPSLGLLFLLFLWIFFWEIGGQNIPADWVDVHQDRSVKAKTLPIQLGFKKARILVLGSLLLAVVFNLFFLAMSPLAFRVPGLVITGVVSLSTLLIPAWRLYQSKGAAEAKQLFNRASYYPLWILLLIGIGLCLA